MVSMLFGIFGMGIVLAALVMALIYCLYHLILAIQEWDEDRKS